MFLVAETVVKAAVGEEVGVVTKVVADLAAEGEFDKSIPILGSRPSSCGDSGE